MKKFFIETLAKIYSSKENNCYYYFNGIWQLIVLDNVKWKFHHFIIVTTVIYFGTFSASKIPTQTFSSVNCMYIDDLYSLVKDLIYGVYLFILTF